MKQQEEKNYYTTGVFAKMAGVTIRTIRYYDKQNILKPSYVNDVGYRFYTDEDFAKLQRVLVLKYLGFSLEEIRMMPLKSAVSDMADSFQMQLKLIRQKKEHLEQIEKSLCNAQALLEEQKQVNWQEIIHLIHLTNLENRLIEQYQTATNLDIRIELHHKYSVNPKGWFPWIYEQLPLQSVDRMLEIGCGSGQLWASAKREQLLGKKIILTDLSKGMLTEAEENIERYFGKQRKGHGEKGEIFEYLVMDGQELTFLEESFQLVIANHVMFYMKDIRKAVSEIERVLKGGGTFICSTYGKEHMKEITELVQEFDSKIRLSEVNLYDQFGLENGEQYLREKFQSVELRLYEDALLVPKAEPIVDYVLSCHGNQRELLDGRTEQFLEFVEEKIKRNGVFRITKEAGIFVCRK